MNQKQDWTQHRARATRMARASAQLAELIGWTKDDNYADSDISLLFEQLSDLRQAIRWVMGDIILSHSSRFSPMRAYRAAARGMQKSIRWAVELAQVSSVFPPEYRLVDADWHLYRLARRKDNPHQTLIDTLADKEQEYDRDSQDDQ